MGSRVVIIGNISTHPSAEIFQRKFLRIIMPLSSHLTLISGNAPDEPTTAITWIRVDFPAVKDSFPIRLIRQMKYQIRTALLLVRLTRKEGVDVVIFLSSPMVPILMAKILGKRTIRHQGGSFYRQIFGIDRNLKGLLMSLILEKIPSMMFDRIVVASEGCIDFQKLGKYRNKIEISGLYVDTRNFKCTSPVTSRENVIGYFGALTRNKGVQNLVEAIPLCREYLEQKNAKIEICGNGPLADDIADFIVKNNLQKIVTLDGWIPNDELSDRFNKLKLFILPSSSEGMPNIVLEAMICGTPVLSTPVGAVPDLIKDGESGFIMENNTPLCISNNIKRVLELHELDDLTQRGIKAVLKRFDYESALSRWRGIIQKES